MAMGFPGEPVPPPISSGATTNRNSHRPRSAQASASRSKRRLSSRWMPIPTMAHMWIAIGHSGSDPGIMSDTPSLPSTDGSLSYSHRAHWGSRPASPSAEPWDVEQHPPAHDAVLGDLDR